jgi:hypothetical protein
MGGVKKVSIMFVSALTMGIGPSLHAQEPSRLPSAIPFARELAHQSQADSTKKSVDLVAEPTMSRNTWGLDILLSNDGFGLGTFYRRQFTEEVSGFASFSISESKDEREIDQYDPYTNTSFTPGKLNRFLVLPLMVGIQYRLFRDDITDTFRPYVNAGAGPTMIYSSPFADLTPITNSDGTTSLLVSQVEFFKSIGRGQAHYTAGGFVGVGANFGSEKSSTYGINFRYYFTYLLGDGLPSLFDMQTGNIAARKKDFGGFFITLNVGMVY